MKKINSSRGQFLYLLIGYIYFLFSIQVITIGLSVMHVGISGWAARAILAVAVGNGLLFFFLGRARENRPEFGLGGKPGMIWLSGFLGLAVMIYLALWLAAYIMPDLSWDGNAYHIPTMAMWDAQGYIHWIKTQYLEGFINGYPKGMELVSYVSVKAFGNSIINATNLIFLPLGVLGIATLTSFLGAKPWLALSTGAAFILIPVNINQAVTTYVDSSFASAAIGLLGIAGCLCRRESQDWRNITAFGAAIGLTLSIKSTGVAISGMAFIAIAIVWLLDRRGNSSISSQSDDAIRLARKKISLVAAWLVIIGIAVAGGGYWYLRNWFITGSPLYPAGLLILGHSVFPGPSVIQVIAGESNTPELVRGLPSFVQVLYTWAQGLRAWPLSLIGYDTRQAGLGFLWLVGCIPAIAISFFHFNTLSSFQKRIFLVLISVISIAFLITPLHWWARYTLWIYGLGLPFLALVLSNSAFNPLAGRMQRAIAMGWMIFCIGLLSFEGIYCTVNVIALAPPEPIRSHLAPFYRPGGWKWPPWYLDIAIQNTPLKQVLTHFENTALGPLGEMDIWDYYGLVGELSQPIGARKLSFLAKSIDETQQETLAGIRYVIWDQSVPLPPYMQSQAISVQKAKNWLVLTMP